MNKELKVTDEYSEVEYEGEVIKIYNSFSNKRLEEETYKEYKIRRKALNNYYKSKNKGTLKHLSSALIPKIEHKVINGEVKEVLSTDHNGNIVYIGKTKGETYYKDKKTEHLNLVEKLKDIANGK